MQKQEQKQKRFFSHLNWNNRLKIEQMYNDGRKPQEIANALHFHVSTIYRELERGKWEHLNTDLTTDIRYSPDIAQGKAEQNMTALGPDLKIGNDHAYAEYLEKKIADEGFSPEAALGAAEQEKKFDTTICTATLYNYIPRCLFARLTSEQLPRHGKGAKVYKRVRASRAPRGESIDNRPDEVKDRKVFGHWEMDTVVGKKGGDKDVLLVLTERKTRDEIIRKIKDKTTASVVRAVNGLERKYGKMFPKIFKSITCDNGCEFQDFDGISNSVLRKGKRTQVYFCHPYSSFERGSNENNNILIRRWFPKGTDFGKVTHKAVQNVEDWMNNYPRRLLGFYTSKQLFDKEVQLITT